MGTLDRDLATVPNFINISDIYTIFDELIALAKDPNAHDLAYMFSVLSVLITLYNIYKHLRNYTHPILQKQIIRILATVPVYSIFSYLILVHYEYHEYLLSIRDIWEAVIVYSFLILILEYGGGENMVLAVIMNNPGSIDHPPPFGVCLPRIRLDSHFMRFCKRATLQFVVIMPCLALFNIFLMLVGAYENKMYLLLLSFVFNVSYTIALYSLVLFYFATHDHPGIKDKRPLAKFLSIKSLVFLTYYQGLLLPQIFNAFLICCEMMLFAVILNILAFNWREFDTSSAFAEGINGTVTPSEILPDQQSLSTMENGHAFRPNGYDSGAADETKKRLEQSGKLIHNALDAISLRDMTKDAYYNFSNKYVSHVQVSGSAAAPIIGLQKEEKNEEKEKTGTEKVFGNDVYIDENDVIFVPNRRGSVQSLNRSNSDGPKLTTAINPFDQNASSAFNPKLQLELTPVIFTDDKFDENPFPESPRDTTSTASASTSVAATLGNENASVSTSLDKGSDEAKNTDTTKHLEQIKEEEDEESKQGEKKDEQLQ